MNTKKSHWAKIISCLLLIVFAGMLGLSYSLLKADKQTKNDNYNKTLTEINDFNKYYNNITSNQGNINTSPDNALFDNGRDFLLTGYEKFTNSDSFKVRIAGEIIADASVVKYTIILRCYITKTPEQVEAIINMYCDGNKSFNNSSKAIYKGNTVYEYSTDRITFENDEIYADYTDAKPTEVDAKEYKEIHGTLPGELFYIVNSKTVTSTDNFYIKKDLAGNITSYNTNFTISTTVGTTDYNKMLLNCIAGSKDFNFSLASGSIIADKEGNITTLYTKDDYTFYYKLFGAYWKVNCKSNMTFEITYV